MKRRDMVFASASLLGLGLAVRADDATAGSKPAPAAAANAAAPGHQALIDAAYECIKAGERCQTHCLNELSQGHTMMAECAGTVEAMLATCRALASLAAQNSPHLKAMAALCATICRDCEAACKKHAGHHEICKQCMETCGRCATACEALPA